MGPNTLQLKVGQITVGSLIWTGWCPAGRNSHEAAGSASCDCVSLNRQ